MPIQQITYNGYTFGEYSHVKLSMEMVYDESDRSVLYHKHLLTVDGTIYGDATENAAGDHVLRLRRRLSKPGERLILDHAGFGGRLDINASSSSLSTDVAFGPKPRIITWDPVGNTNAIEFTWQCEFCIPICDGSQNERNRGIAALNYQVGYRINRSGYTTRTITGYIEIAMTRIAGGRMPDTADAYRDAIQAFKPVNCEREIEWRLSADKRRADFTIIDSELETPNAYPAGVVKISASHHVAWSIGQSAQVRNTISGTVQLAPNQARFRAWEIFRAIVFQRLSFAPDPKQVFIDGLEIDEELYEHNLRFSVSYRIIGVNFRQDLFRSTGVMSHLTSDWSFYANSMANVQTHRGIAKHSHNATEDQLIDLCTTGFNQYGNNPYLPPAPVPPPTAYPPLEPRQYQEPEQSQNAYRRFLNQLPDPYKSWLKFEATLTVADTHETAYQLSLGKDDLRKRDLDPRDPGTVGDTDTKLNMIRIVEESSAALAFIWEGTAERVGYQIPRPMRIQIGTVFLIPKGKQYFVSRRIGLVFGQPLYEAAWRMTYVVDRRPNVSGASSQPWSLDMVNEAIRQAMNDDVDTEGE